MSLAPTTVELSGLMPSPTDAAVAWAPGSTPRFVITPVAVHFTARLP